MTPRKPPKPRQPTKRQREIGERFKAGESVEQLMYHYGSVVWSIQDRWNYVERAIQACLVWGGRRG